MFTACLVAGEMVGSVKAGFLLLAEVAHVLGTSAAKRGWGRKKREHKAQLKLCWRLCSQKLSLPYPSDVFSSFATFQSLEPLKIQNLAVVNDHSKVRAEYEDSL